MPPRESDPMKLMLQARGWAAFQKPLQLDDGEGKKTAQAVHEIAPALLDLDKGVSCLALLGSSVRDNPQSGRE